MRLLPDGKIIAVGAVNNRFGIMRFNSDLTLDTTFGTNGVTMSDFGEGRDAAWEIIPHPEGGWLVSGRSCIARYTDDGQLDASFGTNGRIDNGFLNIGNTMAITADGKLLVGGWDGAITAYRSTPLMAYTKPSGNTINPMVVIPACGA